VINGQNGRVPAAVLAGEIVAPENFMADGFDFMPGTMDHFVKADDRRLGVGLIASMDDPSAVCDECGFITKNQNEGPADITDIKRLKISIEHQDLL